MTSDSTGSGRDPVEQLAESFQARLRLGERPSLEEYIERCPERADDIRELFPALVEMEQFKPLAQAISGQPDQPSTRPESHPRLAADHPQRLGDYHILRVIGSGGMGVVYEAEHESLKNRVALKVMHPRFRTDASYLRRFQTEARSAARLHHTNIVPVFDYGQQDGICYYAMPLIAGVGLHQVLDDVRRLRATDDASETPDADGPFHEVAEPIAHTLRSVAEGLLTGRFAVGPATSNGSDLSATTPVKEGDAARDEGNGKKANGVGSSLFSAESRLDSHSMAGHSDSVYHKEIARLASQVADALDHAHRQGVVHRDIKPSNLLFDARGNVWVTDFGLAKLVEGDELSQSHDLVGTLRFMAPERFRGVTDRRGDIYALGATLYEMLSLRPAFAERDQIRLIDQITHQAPEPLRQRDRQIPRDLETIVLKALAKDPKDRFATAGELRDELRRFLESRPIKSRPVGPAEQFWRWCKRNPGLATANITAAVLTTLLAIGSTIAAWTYRDQLHNLDIEQQKTRSNLNRALNAERQGRLELGKSLQAEGAALERTGLLGQRFDSLERLTAAASELRDHPDGRTRLPELRDQAITAMGLTDLRRVQRREIGPVMDVACDPTFDRYAVTELLAKAGVGGQAVVRSMADDRELLRLPRPEQGIWWAWPVFSPNGQYLMLVYGLPGGGNLINVWRIGDKTLVCRRRLTSGWAFHPDGQRLLLGTAEKSLSIWGLREGRELKRLPLEFSPSRISIAPDGRRVAVNAAGESRIVEIVDLETGRVLDRWVENVGDGQLKWSHDGRLLAMEVRDGKVGIWDVQRAATTTVLEQPSGGLADPVFSPIGHIVSTVSVGSIQFWNASTGEKLVSASIGQARMLSSDGRRLAVYDGSHLDIWEISPSQELLTLNPSLIGNGTKQRQRGLIYGAQFSPDGRLIAFACEENAHLHDARSGRQLAQLDVGYCMTVLFDRGGHNLITYSDRGLFRWPIRDDPSGGHAAFSIGPPELLREPVSKSRFKAAWLPDGRTMALADHDHYRIHLVDTQAPHPARKGARSLATPGFSRLISIDVSPDGRWAAAGGWNDVGVYVWDLPRRRLERILPKGDSPADGHTLATFSPDGRWLVTVSQLGARLYEVGTGYSFWQVGTWKRTAFVPIPQAAGWGEPVFSPDGAMIALCHAPNQIRLAETATGRTITDLTTLESLAPTPLAFSPDGSRLIAATNRLTALVWDLRRIRDQLRSRDLDWDAPTLPPENRSAGDVSAIRVIGKALPPEPRRAAELAACEARLRDHPDDVQALLDRGWLKLKMSKAAEAVADLKRSLQLRPDDADALYLLAAAQVQANDAPAARATITKYLAREGDDTDAYALKARLELQLGMLQEATEDLSKVLDLDPTRVAVQNNRAQARLRLGRLDDALADLNALVLKYPNDSALLGLRGQVHTRLGHGKQALADMKQAAGSPLAGAKSYNNLAWWLATGPAALHDPQQALVLARKAVALTPGTAIYLNTLGVAQYCADQYAEAIGTLEKSLTASKGESDGFDLFFLAMARFKLGQIDRARADLDRALRWRREHPNLPGQWTDELNRFQAEAEALLGTHLPSLPADPFAPGGSGEKP